MPGNLSRPAIALKALRQLGIGQVSLYARYRLGLYSGWLGYKSDRDVSRALDFPPSAFTLSPLLHLPDPSELRSLLGSDGVASLFAEADEIVAGHARLFGGEPVPLDLTRGASNIHWSEYALGRASYGVPDVKFLWEPARFGWAFTLGRAYHLGGDERYAATFWNYLEAFLEAHPPNHGLHWVSAQEVALRILVFSFTAGVFAPSRHTTPQRLTRLGRAAAAHAARIPSTLSYARAQNNNHLLSEAVGLITAGRSLRDHPQAPNWSALGWHWLNRGLLDQISLDGSYTQHSTSYHRLMLQLALWVHCIPKEDSRTFPPLVREHLSAATSWLLALLDETSGRVPNLGSNDGAYILPLTVCPHTDYRPVLQAASLVFLEEPIFPHDVWDEMSLWLDAGNDQVRPDKSPRAETNSQPLVLHNQTNDSWAYLRAAHFTSRPGHADQLHLDLWFGGLNLAQDAGTYLYNAPPPWDNSLAPAAVHNTLTVNNKDQMLHAGRFLYLDWAQAKVVHRQSNGDDNWGSFAAQHDGYQRIGVIHQRTVAALKDGNWLIKDHLLPAGQPTGELFHLHLHWLIPDWHWTVQQLPDNSFHVDLGSPLGNIGIHTALSSSPAGERSPHLLIARAGKTVYGDGGVSPTSGWVSPTYGLKLPALSISFQVEDRLPVVLTTHWLLPLAAGEVQG